MGMAEVFKLFRKSAYTYLLAARISIVRGTTFRDYVCGLFTG